MSALTLAAAFSVRLSRHILTHSPARSFVYPKAPTRMASGYHATMRQHHGCAQKHPPQSELAIPPAAEMHCCVIESRWGFLCLTWKM